MFLWQPSSCPSAAISIRPSCASRWPEQNNRSGTRCSNRSLQYRGIINAVLYKLSGYVRTPSIAKLSLCYSNVETRTAVMLHRKAHILPIYDVSDDSSESVSAPRASRKDVASCRGNPNRENNSDSLYLATNHAPRLSSVVGQEERRARPICSNTVRSPLQRHSRRSKNIVLQ